MSKDEALAFIKTMPRRGETVTTDGQSSYAHFLNEMRRAKELCPVEFEKRWNEPLMTDNEIVGEQIKAKQETLAWRNAFKTKFEQDEPFTDLDLSAWLAIQDVLGLIKGNGTQYASNYFISKDTIFQAITNRIGGK